MDVGALHVLGPTPLRQARTCVAGLPCRLDSATGHHVPSQAFVMALDTCGAASYVPGLAAAAGVVAAGSGEMAVSWGSVSVTAAGATYRLCWCAGAPCSAAEHFFVEFGDLTILGPSPLRQDLGTLGCRMGGWIGVVSTPPLGA